MSIIHLLIFMVLTLIIPLLISIAYLTLLERKEIAAIQGRKGPNVVGIFGLLQPLADGLKLFAKELIIPTKSDVFLFIIAPILTFSLSLISWIVLPISSIALNIELGILFILVVSSLAVYGIIIAGWASNSNYALLGALRSAAQMISYEVSIGLLFIPIILFISSFNFEELISYQQSIWNLFHLLPVFILFFISALAETNRAPFDLPEAEAELVAGYNVEYSGMAFALFFLGEYNNMIIICVLMTLLFLGGWFTPLNYNIFLYDYFVWDHFRYELLPNLVLYLGIFLVSIRQLLNVRKQGLYSRVLIRSYSVWIVIIIMLTNCIQFYSPLEFYAHIYNASYTYKLSRNIWDAQTIYLIFTLCFLYWQEILTNYFDRENYYKTFWKTLGIITILLILLSNFLDYLYMYKDSLDINNPLFTKIFKTFKKIHDYNKINLFTEYPISIKKDVSEEYIRNGRDFKRLGLYSDILHVQGYEPYITTKSLPISTSYDLINTLNHKISYKIFKYSFESSFINLFFYFFMLPVKVFFLLYLFILTRAALPRYRYDQLMQIGWKMILPISLIFVTGYSFNIFYFIQFEHFF